MYWFGFSDVTVIICYLQVRIVCKDDEENIPNFDDIFRDDEDEEEVCKYTT